MKTLLLFFMIAFSVSNSTAQSIVITSLNASPVSNGLNVSLNTTSFSGAGYLSDSYTINQNVITLSVCYWFNNTLPVLTFHHDIFIPMNFAYSNYTLIVTIHNSISNTACDYFSVTDSETLAFLSKSDFNPKQDFALYPNPTNGKIYIKNNDLNMQHISVYDNLGRLVKEISSLAENNFDLSDLTDGIYLVNFTAEKNNFTQKIIVKK